MDGEAAIRCQHMLCRLNNKQFYNKDDSRVIDYDYWAQRQLFYYFGGQKAEAVIICFYHTETLTLIVLLSTYYLPTNNGVKISVLPEEPVQHERWQLKHEHANIRSFTKIN